MSDKMEAAQKALDDAVVVVCRCAQDVADNAQYTTRLPGANYIVPMEDMDELKDAMKQWKAATADFLLAVHEGAKAANEKGGAIVGRTTREEGGVQITTLHLAPEVEERLRINGPLPGTSNEAPLASPESALVALRKIACQTGPRPDWEVDELVGTIRGGFRNDP